MDREIYKLIKSIKDLSEQNKKLVSLKYSFFRGIIFGLGSALGASLIAAIVISLVVKFFKSFQNTFGL